MLQRPLHRTRGFTLVELLVVIAIIATLIGLLLPAVADGPRVRTSGECQNNLKQMGLAVRGYESAIGCFPPPRLDPDWQQGSTPKTSYTNYQSVLPTDKSGFYSVHIWILPFMEAKRSPTRSLLLRHRSSGCSRMATPNNNYQVYAQAMGLFLCPSDGNRGRLISENSYRCNTGGSTPYGGAPNTNQQNVRTGTSSDGFPSRGTVPSRPASRLQGRRFCRRTEQDGLLRGAAPWAAARTCRRFFRPRPT